jgi:hypothetical protein
VDRRAHGVKDDLELTTILEHAPQKETAENSARYTLFTMVQPFVPSRIGYMTNGKIFLPEMLWYSREVDLRPATQERIVFDADASSHWLAAGWFAGTLWGALTLLGLVILVQSRDRRAASLFLLFGLVAAAQAALIVLGRMNIRGSSELMSFNSHYAYMGLLWALPASAVALAQLARVERKSIALPVGVLAGLLVAGLIGLAAASGYKLHALNVQVAEVFAPDRSIWRSLTYFFDTHRHEPDFCYAVSIDPTVKIRRYSEVVLPYVVDLEHVNRDDPKYVLWYENNAFHSALTPEFRRRHPECRGFYATLIRPGHDYFIFECDRCYFAAPPYQVRPFLHAANLFDDKAVHHESSLPRLMQWIKEQTP